MALRRLITKAVAFLLVVSCVNLGLILGTAILLDRASFLLPPGKNTLVVGNSQVECAIDPSVLDQVASIAQGGEAYLYSYLKIRRFLEDNPGLDTIWLAYNLNSLDRQQDTLTRTARYTRYKLPYTFFMLSPAEFHVYWSQPCVYGALAGAPYIHREYVGKALRGPTSFHDLELGGFLRLDRYKLDVDLARRDSSDRTTPQPQPDFGKALDQVEYLRRTIELCRAKDVTCILLSTPVHPAFKARTDTIAFRAYWQQHMPEITLWDHSGWELPDSCFGDATHLNHRGARLYSERLKALRAASWQDTAVH